ncbi:hypothetical protein BBP40_002060 [Aspergillus hancockii]|nr:hypothetical protein BBP40_002060 [Aspergillus hancockii]
MGRKLATAIAPRKNEAGFYIDADEFRNALEGEPCNYEMAQYANESSFAVFTGVLHLVL